MVPQRIALTASAIVVPKSDWSSQEVEIPYPTIIGIRELQGPSAILMVVHRGGMAQIHASRLAMPADYATIRQVLAEQTAVQ